MLNFFGSLFILFGLPVIGFTIWVEWFVKRRDHKSRRPFDEMPRPPGWSLNERMQDMMSRYVVQFMCSTMISVFAWALLLYGKIPSVYIYMFALPASILMLVIASRTLVSYANHRLGLLGEQVVGQVLDQISGPELRVYHDLEIKDPGRKTWNIDHVVVTYAGVFAIETKARRKPRRTKGGQKGHHLIYDGKQIIFPNPMKPDRRCLQQANKNSETLSQKLSTQNGGHIPVTPVLVFPGWWVECKAKGPVSVMNAKQLPNFLANRNRIFSDQQFRAITNQLEEKTRIDLSAPS